MDRRSTRRPAGGGWPRGSGEGRRQMPKCGSFEHRAATGLLAISAPTGIPVLRRLTGICCGCFCPGLLRACCRMDAWTPIHSRPPSSLLPRSLLARPGPPAAGAGADGPAQGAAHRGQHLRLRRPERPGQLRPAAALRRLRPRLQHLARLGAAGVQGGRCKRQGGAHPHRRRWPAPPAPSWTAC
jgi:hypothetical protein